MAIRGAFSAGLVKGFATSLQDRIKENQERFNELVDSQMDTVRRAAPKMAQSMAEAKNADLIRQEMKAQFGVSDEEFLAIAQNYDVTQVYGAIQKAQSNLPEGSKIDKSQFLGSLDIPKGVTLPEGMTAEQALENIYLGYARNIASSPDDKSEVHKTKSWGQALKDTLMLDPASSAEDHLSAMQYMGIPVQDVLTYQAATGGRYEPLPGVKRVKGFDIEVTDYKDTDYSSTANTYERTFTRTFAGTDDLANATNVEGALEALAAKDETELGSKLRKGGIAIADLELALSQSGVDSQLTRDQALLRLSKEVNTSAEMDNLLAGVENGLASELILESLEKNGKLTDEYIEYILTGTKPDIQETSAGGTDDRTSGPRDIMADMAVPRGLGAPDDDEEEEAEVVVDEEDVVSTILSNTPDEDEEEDESGINFASGNARAVAQQQEDYKERAMEAASKITYEEYEAMSDDEKREAGLPVRDTDFRLVFGYLSPKRYFKGAATQIDVGDITEDMNVDSVDPGDTRLADAAINVYKAMEDEFPDMSVLKGEDGKTIIRDYMEMNNLPVNETVIRMIQMQLPNEE
jgi:hypothetical protein